MGREARGIFEVKITPQPAQEGVGDPSVGRMAIEKRFHGEFDGTGRGQMLAMGTAVDGSAGYVAMERVSGTLHGRSGSFALQHTGTMKRGTPRLSVTIVPDSGTEGLSGIEGRLDITIADGVHHYALAYELPDTA
ncbi:DUF3224 domain-containing protein [Dyella sedimenti]|uniref:DUF3224 domain-containing protein n=1 Tax=Dyella sedimenti TaxID=2919947 RepID=UPI001FA9F71D|nr:DUF3224 domain-containing protein [Dyella sedimenti]